MYLIFSRTLCKSPYGDVGILIKYDYWFCLQTDSLLVYRMQNPLLRNRHMHIKSLVCALAGISFEPATSCAVQSRHPMHLKCHLLKILKPFKDHWLVVREHSQKLVGGKADEKQACSKNVLAPLLSKYPLDKSFIFQIPPFHISTFSDTPTFSHQSSPQQVFEISLTINWLSWNRL